MKTKLIPYYLSRAVLSALLGWFMAYNLTPWVGVLTGTLTFAGFLWYAHSGRYLIDPSHPLTPLRRDTRGSAIRDRAVVIAVGVAGLVYFALFLLGLVVSLPAGIGAWALIAGVVAYFAVTNWLFVKD
jgi:hypothetical protein